MTPSRSRRFAVASAIVGIGAAILSARAAPVAVADDEWRAPDYSASDMALEPEAMPEGWKLLSEDAKPRPEAEKAITDAIDALREEHKIARTDVTVVLRTLTTAEGASATLALVDLWQDPAKFPAALEAKSKEMGWGSREMASPARLLVVAAPDRLRREEVTGLQVRVAALRLAMQSLNLLDNRIQDKAEALARASLSLEPGTALAHVTLGILAQPKLGPENPRPEASAWDASVVEFRLAVDLKASVPLTVPQRSLALGTLGDALIWQGGEKNAEGRDRLKEALALAAPGAPSWGNRYNLACVHGRLKELDEAFAQLSLVLERDAKEKVAGIEHWRTDPDFDNLHADPRWAALLEKYPAGGKPGDIAPPDEK